MLTNFVVNGSTAFSFLAIAFAIVLGGRAEKLGGGLVLSAILSTWIAQALWGMAPLYAFLPIDFAAACGFGILTARFPDKLWPGLAGCAQLLVFVFSATRAIDFPLSETAYLIMLNVSGFGVALALAGGTAVNRWHKPAPSQWDIAAEKLAA